LQQQQQQQQHRESNIKWARFVVDADENFSVVAAAVAVGIAYAERYRRESNNK